MVKNKKALFFVQASMDRNPLEKEFQEFESRKKTKLRLKRKRSRVQLTENQ